MALVPWVGDAGSAAETRTTVTITLDELTVRMDALSDEDRASIEALGPGRPPEDYPPELRRAFQAMVDDLSAEDRAILQAVLDDASAGDGDVEGFKMKSTSGDAPHQAPPGMTPPANGGGVEPSCRASGTTSRRSTTASNPRGPPSRASSDLIVIGPPASVARPRPRREDPTQGDAESEVTDAVLPSLLLFVPSVLV